MKKLVKAVATILILAFCCAIGFGIYTMNKRKDHVPPVISFDEDKELLMLSEELIEQVMERDYSCLLDYANVKDDHDGDITERLVIDSVVFYDDNSFALVNYKANDNEGNVASAQRIAYIRTPEEIFEIVSERVRDEYGVPEEEVEEEPQVEDQKPILVMMERVELEVGQPAKFEEYVLKIEDDIDSVDMLLKNYSSEGYVDFNTPGEYVLDATVTDSAGNVSDPSQIIVTVIEKIEE